MTLKMRVALTCFLVMALPLIWLLFQQAWVFVLGLAFGSDILPGVGFLTLFTTGFMAGMLFYLIWD